MSDIHLRMPPKDFGSAKRQFMEIYGSTAVGNTYLKIAVLTLSGVCVGLTIQNAKLSQALRDHKPVIIRIDDAGRPEVMSQASLEYRPREAEIRHFLMQFVRQHYGRIRATAKDDYARSLYFLEGRLADAAMEADQKTKAMELFLAGHGEEVDVRVTNVAIEDLRTPPYRAMVDFEKVYLASPDRQESRREKYVGNFVFTLKERVPNAWVPINPLGLTIIYFREDQAFQ